MDSSNTEKKWDVKRDAKIFCNLSFGAIKRMILGGVIKEDDLVWHTGMSGYRNAGEQEELIPLFRTSGGNEAKKTDQEIMRCKTCLPTGKILVVDDEPDMLELMLRVLAKKGYQSLGATNGPDGIRLNEQEQPDLIVLDLRMPGMDGIETLRHIRQKDAKVRVIILTGYGHPDTIRDAADLDVSEYLSKSFDNDALVRIIGEVLGRPWPSSGRQTGEQK